MLMLEAATGNQYFHQQLAAGLAGWTAHGPSITQDPCTHWGLAMQSFKEPGLNCWAVCSKDAVYSCHSPTHGRDGLRCSGNFTCTQS